MTQRLELVAADGTRLSALLDEPDRAGAEAVVLLPGFWRRAESVRIRWLAAELARRWRVFTLDFRGHGLSGGTYSFGRHEHLDVEALLQLAASRGVERVALVGMSMGAASIATTLGARPALPLEVAGAVLIAAPSGIRAVRPMPWRGQRDVAWQDLPHLPRVDWRVIFPGKRSAAAHWDAFPEIPVRFLHARGDWLIDSGEAERLHARQPARGDFYLLETPGLHADELLGRHRSLVLRLVRPFVDSVLASPADVEGAGDVVDPGPWRAAMAQALGTRSSHSSDLGGVALGGAPDEVVAVGAGRDGVHLVMRAGPELAWARGLRDGSVHGLNLLGNALAADAPLWPRAVREALREVHSRLGGGVAPGPGSRHLVVPRGDGGFEVRPRGE